MSDVVAKIGLAMATQDIRDLDRRSVEAPVPAIASATRPPILAA
jgi:hypothetical protein